MRRIDEIAMHAMAGLLATDTIDASDGWIAKRAYEIAEAMLEEAKVHV